MRVHVVQVGYDDSTEPRDERVARVRALVRAQRGADLVVLPELWADGGFATRSWPAGAEVLDAPPGGPVVGALGEVAVEIGATLHVGSVVERPGAAAGSPLARDGGGPAGAVPVWNTSVVIGPDGGWVARYRKIHRFGFRGGEAAVMDAGDAAVTATVDGAVLGLAICYDLRFPELFRALLDLGAVGFVVPAAWPAARIGHWTLLGRARAVENQCVMIQCNAAGVSQGVELGGRSQVVDATGEVLAEAGTGEEVLRVDLDVDAVAAYRSAFPVLADRRL